MVPHKKWRTQPWDEMSDHRTTGVPKCLWEVRRHYIYGAQNGALIGCAAVTLSSRLWVLWILFCQYENCALWLFLKPQRLLLYHCAIKVGKNIFYHQSLLLYPGGKDLIIDSERSAAWIWRAMCPMGGGRGHLSAAVKSLHVSRRTERCTAQHLWEW